MHKKVKIKDVNTSKSRKEVKNIFDVGIKISYLRQL